MAPLLRLVWFFGSPVRAYWLHSERKLGKRFVLERIIKPLLPPRPSGFHVHLPGGGHVHVHYREDLGLAMLLSGGWESAELQIAIESARRGTTAVDAGANVGLYTAALAVAVGRTGRVLAFEPERANVTRLQETVASNNFDNVEIHAVALGAHSGATELHLAEDPMYHSLGEISDAHGTGRHILVEMRKLDDVWRTSGSPTVSFVKIDTEGTELDVLKGAERLLAAERPVLLVEVRDARVEGWLGERGYRPHTPPNFAVGNVLFVPISLKRQLPWSNARQ